MGTFGWTVSLISREEEEDEEERAEEIIIAVRKNKDEIMQLV